jgi:hypothetical protein
MSFDNQVGHELVDFGDAHLAGVALDFAVAQPRVMIVMSAWTDFPRRTPSSLSRARASRLGTGTPG